LLTSEISSERVGLFSDRGEYSAGSAFQVGEGGKDAAIDYVALQLAEPALDWIEPRRVGWREVQLHIGVLLQKAFYQVRFVSGTIVQEDMHLPLYRLGCDNFF